MDPEQVKRNAVMVSSYIKTATGAANNAAWLICLEAHDYIKQHPNYHHAVKGAYKKAFAAFHRYENTLLHSSVNRMFHVDDMPADVRAKYGDITDREFYDMWCSCGAAAYEQSRPLITSLWNKYRVSLIKHDIPHADLLAWVMTANCGLNLAVRFYQSAITGAVKEWHFPRALTERVFCQFSLEPVLKEWKNALLLTNPKGVQTELDEVEERNIIFGIQQLEEAWSSPDVMFGSIYATVKDYKENFANKHTHRAAMKEILQVKKNFESELA